MQLTKSVENFRGWCSCENLQRGQTKGRIVVLYFLVLYRRYLYAVYKDHHLGCPRTPKSISSWYCPCEHNCTIIITHMKTRLCVYIYIYIYIYISLQHFLRIATLKNRYYMSKNHCHKIWQ